MLFRRISIFLLAAAIIYPLVIQVIFPEFVVDDAYITFRYAENLALHGELNWNIGENPVEGYTGVALPVLLAGFITIGISPVTASHGIGLFSFWLTFLMLLLIARRLKVSRLLEALLLLLYATTPILFTHSWSGMETMLFVAMMVSALYAFLRGAHRWFFILLLFTSLVRPEGVAFAALFIVAAGWVNYRHHPTGFKSFLMSFFLIYLLPATVYFLWRFNYYGRLLPNTFYAKSDTGFSLNITADIFRFLRRYLALPVLGGLFLLTVETDWLKEKIKKDYANSRFLAPVCAGALFCLAVILVLSRSHLIANFSTRFYVSLLGVLWGGLLLLWRLGDISLERLKVTQPTRYNYCSFLFVGLILYQSLFQSVKIKDEMKFARQQIILHEDAHNAVGKDLRRLLPVNETVIVYLDAGAIPYFSKLRAVDFGDLNDELLASHTLTPAGRLDYFFSQKAGAVSFSSINAERVDYGPEAVAILNDPRFISYVLYKRYVPRDSDIGYYVFLYLRKDLYEKLPKS